VHRWPQDQPISVWIQWGADQMQPVDSATAHPPISSVPRKPNGPARSDLRTPRISWFSVPSSHDRRRADNATGRRSGRWRRRASALAPACAALLFGTALFAGIFWPKGGSTGARSAVARPALVKILSSEGRPTDLPVDGLFAATPSTAPLEPPRAGVAAPRPVEPPAAAPVTPAAALTAPVPQSAETNPPRTVSAPPDAATAPSATRAGEAAPPGPCSGPLRPRRWPRARSL
jgi:hypothetical protein